MTRRLLLSYLALAVVILLVLEVPLATLAQRFERQLATSQTEKEVNGLVALATEDLPPARRPQLQAVVVGYEKRTGGEVAVLSATGALMAASSDDADRDYQEWTALYQRALGGQSTAAFTADEGHPYTVAAAPVVDEGHVAATIVLGTPAGFTEHRIHEIWLALAVFALGAVLVAVVAGVVLARSLALPLGRLEATVARFGKGDLAIRASEGHGPAEVRSLAHQFNAMAGRLDALLEAQARFVADASHQLRSPLTALRLRLENLEATAADAGGESVAAASQEVQRLSRIVDGLLTLGRAGAGGASPAEVDIAVVMEERCDAWSALAAEKGVGLVAAIDGPARVRRWLHPGDLDQIVDNLLANAVEVAPPGSTISVELRAVRGGEEIHVIDAGPGLPAEDRQRAFDRFWQGSHRSGHSGLGLAIVRQLADRNGLDVEVRAVPSGGLDAVVLLPPGAGS